MARCGGALTHYVERIDLCSDRRLGGGTDHVPARANWWRAQLGLSLLLVARCCADPARAAARGVSRGSHVLAPMVVAGHRRQPGANANDLRRPRRTATS